MSTNAILNAHTWSVDVSQSYVDTTQFGDTMQVQTPTFATWTGTADAHYDIGDTNGQLALQTAWLAGTTCTPKFYVDSTHYYSGLAYVSASIKTDVAGVVDVSYSFTAAGALSYS